MKSLDNITRNTVKENAANSYNLAQVKSQGAESLKNGKTVNFVQPGGVIQKPILTTPKMEQNKKTGFSATIGLGDASKNSTYVIIGAVIVTILATLGIKAALTPKRGRRR